jgi:hypothetical protein
MELHELIYVSLAEEEVSTDKKISSWVSQAYLSIIDKSSLRYWKGKKPSSLLCTTRFVRTNATVGITYYGRDLLSKNRLRTGQWHSLHQAIYRSKASLRTQATLKPSLVNRYQARPIPWEKECSCCLFRTNFF